jgi:hypothetical protein
MRPAVDPEGRRLPIKLDTTSNGEFVPVPLSSANRESNRLAHDAAERNAKRLDISKRSFLVSACGAASTLLAFNAARVYGVSAAEVKKYVARDKVAREKAAYAERPEPHFRTYGPKTRREFLRFAGSPD